MRKKLNFQILAQPDETTCGPTCLHAVYQYYGQYRPIGKVIQDVKCLEGGGTLAALLACDALRKGYRARIYTYNLQVFDPSWFRGNVNIPDRLKKQMRHKKSPRFQAISRGYLEFFELGGTLCFEDLTPALIRKYLKRNVPIITGLSATYLYRSIREYGEACDEDDLRGDPVGHFVILCGYDREKKEVLVADPLESNPFSKRRYYHIDIQRVINAILLGIVTHDANLLIIEPGEVKG